MTSTSRRRLLSDDQAAIADRIMTVIDGHPSDDAFMAMVSIMAATLNHQHAPADARVIAASIAERLVETVERGQRGDFQVEGQAGHDPQIEAGSRTEALIAELTEILDMEADRDAIPAVVVCLVSYIALAKGETKQLLANHVIENISYAATGAFDEIGDDETPVVVQ